MNKTQLIFIGLRSPQENRITDNDITFFSWFKRFDKIIFQCKARSYFGGFFFISKGGYRNNQTCSQTCSQELFWIKKALGKYPKSLDFYVVGTARFELATTCPPDMNDPIFFLENFFTAYNTLTFYLDQNKKGLTENG